jgi:hypothetical protein
VQMWDKIKLWLRDGGCLAEERGLLEDICSPLYWYGDNGKMHLEPTEDIKKRMGFSPDLGSALALTFAAPVVKLDEVQKLSKEPRRCETEYDVLG